MNSLSRYYGETGQIIINTSHGDVILYVYIDFCEHLKVGDKICPCEWIETKNPEKSEVCNAKWLQRIENYISKADNDLELHEILGDASITIESRFLDTTALTLFGELDEYYMKELNSYMFDCTL
jgi:hypothetical protein